MLREAADNWKFFFFTLCSVDDTNDRQDERAQIGEAQQHPQHICREERSTQNPDNSFDDKKNQTLLDVVLHERIFFGDSEGYDHQGTEIRKNSHSGILMKRRYNRRLLRRRISSLTSGVC